MCVVDCDKVLHVIKLLWSPYGLLVLSIILSIVGRYVFNKTYLDCFIIIKKHLQCFKKSNNKISIISLILYFVVPILIALALVQIRSLDESIINLLTVIISIFTSMLFTLLTLILDIKGKLTLHCNANEANITERLLRETFYTIMFEILTCIIILILCFIEIYAKIYAALSSFAIYYLTFVLIFNLFMVLKRVYAVIDNTLDKKY